MGRIPPDQGLSDKKRSGVKGTKVRLTYLFTANADGSEKLPPLIIGKAKKPRAFEKKTGAQLGFHYRNNAKAWMTGDIYQEWLRQWDHKLEERKRKIVLLQDNFSGHIVPDGLRNIHVLNFKPNLTAHVQPMDQGIIGSFKAHYRTKYFQWAINRYERGITPSDMYNIDQLQAMRLANIAWGEVDTTTIRNCWHKAGILPAMDPSESLTSPLAQPAIPVLSLLQQLHSPSYDQDPIAAAKNELICALDDLEAIGVLQKVNRMDLEDLLNPPEESRMEDTTDEEIFQAVMAECNSQEEGPMDGDVEGDAVAEPRPTYHEVIEAASVMSRHVAHIDDPVARQLEVILASMGRQMRLERSNGLTATHITDYFHTI